MSLSTLEILQEAKQLVTKGWCKGNYCIKVSCGGGSTFTLAALYCPLGALIVVSHDHANYITARDVLYDAIGQPVGGIPGWNDRPERTLVEVLAAFDRAIAILEIDQELPFLKEEEHADRLTTV